MSGQAGPLEHRLSSGPECSFHFFSIKHIVRTERDHPAIGRGVVDAASLHALEVEIVGVHEVHGAYEKDGRVVCEGGRRIHALVGKQVGYPVFDPLGIPNTLWLDETVQFCRYFSCQCGF